MYIGFESSPRHTAVTIGDIASHKGSEIRGIEEHDIGAILSAAKMPHWNGSFDFFQDFFIQFIKYVRPDASWINCHAVDAFFSTFSCDGFAQPDHAGLSRYIGSSAEESPACYRSNGRNIYNMTMVELRHVLIRNLTASKYTGQINVDDAFPFILRQIFKFLSADNSGTVDERMDLSYIRNYFF